MLLSGRALGKLAGIDLLFPAALFPCFKYPKYLQSAQVPLLPRQDWFSTVWTKNLQDFWKRNGSWILIDPGFSA